MKTPALRIVAIVIGAKTHGADGEVVLVDEHLDGGRAGTRQREHGVEADVPQRLRSRLKALRY
jgi:hypothetical protein